MITKNTSTYKLIKYWLPLVLYQNLLENDSPLSICKFNPGGLPSLISDNPLILRNPQNFDVYRDDFILPLSRDKILIRTKKIKSQYQNTSIVLVDLLQLRQASRFVATTSLESIPLLRKFRSSDSIQTLRKALFAEFVEE